MFKVKRAVQNVPDVQKVQVVQTGASGLTVQNVQGVEKRTGIFTAEARRPQREYDFKKPLCVLCVSAVTFSLIIAPL